MSTEPRTVTVNADDLALLLADERTPNSAVAQSLRMALPAPEPQYPEWTDEFCLRVDAIVRDDGSEYASDGQDFLRHLYDAGLLVVERDEWERLTAERGLWVSREDHEAALDDAEMLVGRVEAERDEARARIAELEKVHERELGKVIDERDRIHEAADALAYAIAPVEVIGEHSNLNDPWANALEQLGVRWVLPTPDLRPTEEQVREDMIRAGWSDVDDAVQFFKEHGWLRDTEAPPAPPVPERTLVDVLRDEAIQQADQEWAALVAEAADEIERLMVSPLPAEVQAVLDRAEAYTQWLELTGQVGGIDDGVLTGALADTVRAYRATKTQEGEG